MNSANLNTKVPAIKLQLRKFIDAHDKQTFIRVNDAFRLRGQIRNPQICAPN